MSNIKIREQKELQVTEMIEKLTAAKSFVLIDYKGLNVLQDTKLRNEYRKAGVKYSVIKNRLVKIALNNMGYTQFDDALNGPTALAIGTSDIAAPAKIASDKSKEFKKMSIKCGLVEGVFLDEKNVQKLADLPSREVLLSQLVGMLQAPIAKLARTISAISEKLEA